MEKYIIEKETIFNPRFGERFIAEEISTGEQWLLQPQFCRECSEFEWVFEVTLIKNGRPDKRYSRYLGAGEVDDEFPSDTCIFWQI